MMPRHVVAWLLCARIVWQEQAAWRGGRIVNITWLPTMGFTRMEECDRYVATNPKDYEKDGDAMIHVTRYCLPDTVDPREPKR